MPDGRTPATCRASSAPSAVSTAKARWTTISRLNIVASQIRPGATRLSTASSSRAKPNITRTTRANGTTWLSTIRLRSSMRRSLAAISRATPQVLTPPPRRAMTCDATCPAHLSSPRPIPPWEMSDERSCAAHRSSLDRSWAGRRGGEAAGDVDHPGGQAAGALQLVAGDDHGGTGLDGGAQRGVELVPTGGVEAGVGL